MGPLASKLIGMEVQSIRASGAGDALEEVVLGRGDTRHLLDRIKVLEGWVSHFGDVANLGLSEHTSKQAALIEIMESSREVLSR